MASCLNNNLIERITMANHSFNITLAEKYGVEQAILIEHIYWWVHKNECDGIEDMAKDGKVWCRSTAKGFAKYIPYLKPDKIWRILRKMEGHILLVGNFNKQALNQTLWYTFTDEFKKELEDLNYDFENFKNANLKNEKSYNSIINNPINKEDKIKEDKEKVLSDDNTKKGVRFIKPTIEQIVEFISEKKLDVDAEKFFFHYESVGWKVGNKPMKDWRAACHKWARKDEKEKVLCYEPLPSDEEKVKRFKLWMRENHAEIEHTEKPLTFDGYMRLRNEYGDDEVCERLDYIDANIGKYRQSDIEAQIRYYLERR